MKKLISFDNPRRFIRLLSAAAFLSSGLNISSSQIAAAELTWNGVDGNWDSSSINWSNGSINVAFDNGDAAIFDETGTIRDITVIGEIAAGKMRISGAAYTLSLTDITNIGNLSVLQGGNGLIQVGNDAILNIRNSTLAQTITSASNSNSASVTGGIVYLNSGTSLTLKTNPDSTGKINISDNTITVQAGTITSPSRTIQAYADSTNQGAVYLNEGGSTSLENVIFANNSAEVRGGTSISTGGPSGQYSYAYSSSTATGYASTFSNSGTAALTDVSFTNNTNRVIGGTTSSTGYQASRNAYSNAHATALAYGGATYNTGSVEFNNVRFSGNSAYAEGGNATAIPGTPGSGYDTSASAYVAATASGGALYNTGQSAIISEGAFTSNLVSAVGGTGQASSVTATATAQGGAIYQGGYNGQLTITDTGFTGNIAQAWSVQDVTAAQGGAIYQNDGTITVAVTANKNLTYSGNYATGNSGNVKASTETLSAQAQAGGFLYMGGYGNTTAVFDIAANSSLTLGLSSNDANYNAAHDTISGSNSNAVVSKTGAGRLVLNTDNSGYSGTVNVAQGTLNLGNNLARLGGTINVTGGTLSGTGVLTGPQLTVADGGRLSPGDGISAGMGRVAISAEGNITLEQGAVLSLVLVDSNTYTGVNVQGTFSASGARLELDTSHYDFTLNDRFEIVMGLEGSIATGTTFTYGGADIPMGDFFITSNGYAFRLEQNDSSIYLTAISIPEPSTYALIVAFTLAAVGTVRRRKAHSYKTSE